MEKKKILIISALMDIPTITSRLAINKLLDHAYNSFDLDIDHLDGMFATRLWFWYNMKEKDYAALFYYGHGQESKLKGNNIWQSIISKANINKLMGTPISTMACFSAADLGKYAVERGFTKAYIGTITPYFAAFNEKERDYRDDWANYTTSKEIALMDGKTFGEAMKIFYDKATEYIKIYERNVGYKNYDWYLEATRSNRDNTILLGNPDCRI